MKAFTCVVVATLLLACASSVLGNTAEEEFDRHYEKNYGVKTLRFTVGSENKKSGKMLRRRLIAGAFGSLLGAIDGISSTVQGVTSAVQGVVNLFGKQSSEAIVNQLTNRGFSEFSANTRVSISSMHTSVFDAYVEDTVKLMKIPKKHNAYVDNLLDKAKYVYKQEWINLDTTFDEKKGGYARNFQIMIYRDVNCETMHLVVVQPNIKYKLKEDLFIISKSKSSMGGAFSSTKLDWKTGKIPKSLDIDTMKFVNEYFQTMALAKLAESRALIQTEAYREPCLKDWLPPPEQIKPWDEVEGFDSEFMPEDSNDEETSFDEEDEYDEDVEDEPSFDEDVEDDEETSFDEEDDEETSFDEEDTFDEEGAFDQVF